ncbi:MAG: hypothetical protein MHMPM18_002942, partial [Marteilia pararefringens]
MTRASTNARDKRREVAATATTKRPGSARSQSFVLDFEDVEQELLQLTTNGAATSNNLHCKSNLYPNNGSHDEDVEEANFSRTPGTIHSKHRVRDDTELQSGMASDTNRNMEHSKSYSIPFLGPDSFLSASNYSIDNSIQSEKLQSGNINCENNEPSLVYQNLTYQDLIECNSNEIMTDGMNGRFKGQNVHVNEQSTGPVKTNGSQTKSNGKSNILDGSTDSVETEDEIKSSLMEGNLLPPNSSNLDKKEAELETDDASRKDPTNLNENLNSMTLNGVNPNDVSPDQNCANGSILPGYYFASPNMCFMNDPSNRNSVYTPSNTPAFFIQTNHAANSGSDKSSMRPIQSPIFVPFHFDAQTPLPFSDPNLDFNQNHTINNGDTNCVRPNNGRKFGATNEAAFLHPPYNHPIGFISPGHFEYYQYSNQNSLQNKNQNFHKSNYDSNIGARKGYRSSNQNGSRYNQNKDVKFQPHITAEQSEKITQSDQKTNVSIPSTYSEEFPSLSTKSRRLSSEFSSATETISIADQSLIAPQSTTSNQFEPVSNFNNEEYNQMLMAQRQNIAIQTNPASSSITSAPDNMKIPNQKNMRLIDEYRTNGPNNIHISDFISEIGGLSRDQHGSRFVQIKLEKTTAVERQAIFTCLLPEISELICDVFGNYVVQKLLEFGTLDQKRQVCKLMKGRLVELALNTYGCRVVQKAVEVLCQIGDEEDSQLKELLAELGPSTLQLIRDQNGNHVIQKCIEVVAINQQDFLLMALSGHASEVATHSFGCRVIQRLLECYASTHSSKLITPLITELLESVSTLIVNQFGNYVVQHLLKHCGVNSERTIIDEVVLKFAEYAQQKFSSNVCEACISHGTDSDRSRFIQEIFGTHFSQKNRNANSGSSSKNSISSSQLAELQLSLMKDQYANYVIQKLLEHCTKKQRDFMLSVIRTHAPILRKSVHGKHLLMKAEKMTRSHFNATSNNRNIAAGDSNPSIKKKFNGEYPDAGPEN